MTDFTLPELGENINAGDVSRVLVNVGDEIARDQPVIEIETDKATVEVPSTVAGIVKAIRVKAGDTVQVGSVVLSVEEAEEAAGAGREEPPPSPTEQQARETAEKVDAAATGGQQQNVGPTRATPGDKDGTVDPEQESIVTPTPAKVVSMPRSASRGAAEPVPASPMVRRMAREIGVDVQDVQGSGDAGRISQEDVKEHARRVLTSIGPVRARQTESRPLPDFTKWGEIDRQPMSGIRRATADHLTHAWRAIPHVTQADKADITDVEKLRKDSAPQVDEQGGKLTMTAILVKVVALAVREFPQFNASVDMDAEQIIYKKYVNVGVAVDTDRGLLVPVIRNVDTKTLLQIAVEVQHAAQKARDRKLSLDDMSGGGISISNLGGIGGTYFTPIVNWPEVAILGVARGVMEPVHQKDGSFAPRLMLPLSLSYDHRVIDGADAIRFLRWIVRALEQPFLLAL